MIQMKPLDAATRGGGPRPQSSLKPPQSCTLSTEVVGEDAASIRADFLASEARQNPFELWHVLSTLHDVHLADVDRELRMRNTEEKRGEQLE